MIEIHFQNRSDQRVLQYLASMQPRVLAAIRAGMQGSAAQLARNIDTKLSGQVLNIRSGRLRRSIGPPVIQQTDSGITLTIAQDSALAPYARAHEYGASIRVPEIVPLRARVLRFESRTGDPVFAMRARPHQVVLPARSFLRSALQEAEDSIRENILRHMREAM